MWSFDWLISAWSTGDLDICPSISVVVISFQSLRLARRGVVHVEVGYVVNL